jgi:hypothetical protein
MKAKLTALFVALATTASAQTCEEKLEAAGVYSEYKEVAEFMPTAVKVAMLDSMKSELQAICEYHEGRERLSSYWQKENAEKTMEFAVNWLSEELK